MTVKVPFVDFIPQHKPIEKAIEDAINKVIQKGDFVLGGALEEFEQAFAKYCGVGYGVGVASGTDAIALGLQACGVGPGDEVIVPANTFIATLIGVTQIGAIPVIVDCDPNTALMDLKAVPKAITENTKAILPVHLYGQMVSPTQLLKISETYNLILFEDAAQAHGAHREGYQAGAIGMAAAFSFYPSKNLGAFGNGGMLITHEESVAQRVKSLRNYGAPSKYYHTELGRNSRLDTLQAAIVNTKLPYLDIWNQQRREAAQTYDKLLTPLKAWGIHYIENHSQEGHVYHLYVCKVDSSCSWSRDQIREQLLQVDIQTGVHYPIPCHLQPAYKHLGYQHGDFPIAETLSNQIISLPMYPGLAKEQIEFVCEQLSLIIQQNAK